MRIDSSSPAWRPQPSCSSSSALPSRPPKDAVQTRLEQLVVQPKTLEEFELQQPFFERVMRPTIKRLSRVGSRGDQGGMIARTDAKLEKAGYPGGLRGADWMGVKVLFAIVGAILGFILGLALGEAPPSASCSCWVAARSASSVPSSGWAGASARVRWRWSCSCPTRWTC